MKVENIYLELLDDTNLKTAVKLALNARKNLDPFFDPLDICSTTESEIIEKIKEVILNQEYKYEELYLIRYPKNKIDNRIFWYTNITTYSIKYLISCVLKNHFHFSNSIFGGREEIFQLGSGDLFGLINQQFANWQQEIIYKGEYEWVVIADIKDFYNRINVKLLIKKINKFLGELNDDKFKNLLKKYIVKLSIGDWCDNFLQNILLLDIDKNLTNKDWAYGRMIDDFRIFCKTDVDAKRAYDLIVNGLKDLDLEINKEKQFVLIPYDKLENSDRSYSSNLRFQNNNIKDIRYSPYISLKHIGEYHIENLNRIFSSSSVSWLESLYSDKILLRNITLKHQIEGKSGLILEGSDLEIFLKEIEHHSYKPNDPDFNKIIYIIGNGFGNYQFYYRVINDFIEMLIRADEDCCYKYSNLYFSNNPKEFYNSFFIYIFFRILFLTERGTKYRKLLNKNPQIQDGILGFSILAIIKCTNYLREIIMQILSKGLLGPDKTNDLDFWKEREIWCHQIDKYIKDPPVIWEDIEYGKKPFLEFIIDNFPYEPIYKLYLAEREYYNEGFQEALTGYLQFQYNEGLVKRNNLYGKMGYCYDKLNDFGNAKKYYSLSLRINESPTILNNISIIRFQEGNLVDSIMNISKAILIDKTIIYLFNRAGYYYYYKDFNSCYGDLKEVIKEFHIKSNDNTNLDLFIESFNYTIGPYFLRDDLPTKIFNTELLGLMNITNLDWRFVKITIEG